MKNSFLLLLALVLAVPLVPFVLIGEIDVMKWIEGSSGIITFIYGALLLASDIFLPLPSSLIAVFLGAKLGLAYGAIAVFLGLMGGSLIGYGMGWTFGRKVMDKMISRSNQEVYTMMGNRIGYWALALCRSVPMLAEASVIAAGVARLEVKKTMPLLVMSNLGLAILYSTFGFFGNQQFSPWLLFAGGVLIPACGVLILLLIFGKTLFRPTPDHIC